MSTYSIESDEKYKVYTASDDSWLLANSVKKLSRGRVLDMGTGSGFQALCAAKIKKVKEVLALDINPLAIKHCKKYSFHEKITYKISNLFESLKSTKEKFDTIIFNPPYLPTEGKEIKFLALEGGRQGYELIQLFLENVNNYLKTSGQILLLFSSLSKKKIVEKLIEENLFVFKQLSVQKFFQEQLFVYQIKKSTILKIFDSKKISNLEFFNKGKRGLIYTAKQNNKKIAIKIKNPNSTAINRIKHEGDILKIINQKNIGPKLIFSDEDFLIYEFVEGLLIRDFLKSKQISKTKLKRVLINVLNQCFVLDQLKITKEEMTNPYKHIVIDKKIKNITMLDFERANKDPNPQNITQFCQYILHINRELNELGFKIKRNEIMKLAKLYKHNQTKKNFNNIKNLII